MTYTPTFKHLKGRTLHKLHAQRGIVRLMREVLLPLCRDMQYEVADADTAERFETDLRSALEKLKTDSLLESYAIGYVTFVDGELRCSIQASSLFSDQV